MDFYKPLVFLLLLIAVIISYVPQHPRENSFFLNSNKNLILDLLIDERWKQQDLSQSVPKWKTAFTSPESSDEQQRGEFKAYKSIQEAMQEADLGANSGKNSDREKSTIKHPFPRVAHEIYIPWDQNGTLKQDEFDFDYTPFFKFEKFMNERGWNATLWTRTKLMNLCDEHYPGMWDFVWSRFTHPTQASDFFRAIVTYHFGGLFWQYGSAMHCDPEDFVPPPPYTLTLLTEYILPDAWGKFHRANERLRNGKGEERLRISYGSFAAQPKHHYIEYIIHKAKRNLEMYDVRNQYDILYIGANAMMSEAWAEYPPEKKQDILLIDYNTTRKMLHFNSRGSWRLDSYTNLNLIPDWVFHENYTRSEVNETARKSKKKKRKKSSKESRDMPTTLAQRQMLPFHREIHTIYFPWHRNGTLKLDEFDFDMNLFLEFQHNASEKGWTATLWTRTKLMELCDNHYPGLWNFVWSRFVHPIQASFFFRALVVYHFGGLFYEYGRPMKSDLEAYVPTPPFTLTLLTQRILPESFGTDYKADKRIRNGKGEERVRVSYQSFAAQPRHHFMRYIVEKTKRNLAQYDVQSQYDILYIGQSAMISEAWDEYPAEKKKDILLIDEEESKALLHSDSKGTWRLKSYQNRTLIPRWVFHENISNVTRT